jgi:hypothetical protein
LAGAGLEQHYPTSFYPLPSLDTALVTTTQVLAACFDLLSQVVEDGGVLCWVCLFLSGFVCVVVSASALLCTNVASSYMT